MVRLRDPTLALRLLVAERVVCEVVVKVVLYVGLLQLGRQALDLRRREELVLVGPMALQRDPDLRGVDVFQRRAAVSGDDGI